MRAGTQMYIGGLYLQIGLTGVSISSRSVSHTD